MSSPAARVRADLQARTGVDFADYVDDELIDSVTGWSGLLGIIRELAVAAGAGLAVVLAAVIVAVVAELTSDEATGLVIGGFFLAVGTTVLVFGFRLRRRVPREVGQVFEVASTAVDRVAADIAAGRLNVTAGDAARGVTLVAAIPALTRAAQRRFPLVGWVGAPAVGAVLSRALMRAWPRGRESAPLTGLERPARKLNETLVSVGDSVLPRISTAVRWATVPLLLGGTAISILGASIVFISFSLN